jgi:cell division protein FtsB
VGELFVADFNYELLITSIVSVMGGGLIATLLSIYFNKDRTTAETKKLQTDSDSSIVNAALQIADRLQVQLSQLEDRIDNLDDRNKKLKLEVSELRNQNLEMSANIKILQDENKMLHQENRGLKGELDEYKNSN